MTTFKTDILDNLIVGRIEPHIYAFTTNTVPNYLKVGDTYRPVNVRLDEWRDYFPNLEHESDWEWLAKTKNDKYFRDFSIHYYLETIKRLHRLQPDDIKDLPYYSREFFENATPKDIDEAIQDIEQYAIQTDGSRQYQFYSEERLPEETHFARVDNYDPRPNQENTIQRFIAARKRGRKNLLMYAVMRFGKSFTSMCCATEMNAKIVLVVSAKADAVPDEWQKTVESHTRFAEYDFLLSNNLIENEAISKRLQQGRRVVVFLSLQDLMGDEIKEKHKELFRQHIDLLIVDETHFGARAEEYGKVLRNVNNLKAQQIRQELEKSGESTYEDLEKSLETLKALDVDTILHLSGTPYRILMGSEFEEDDIIAFYQFADIIKEKDDWDLQHKEDVEKEEINPDTEEPYKDWDNPYYGFPQMIRFAFNPNESARRLIEQLKSNGKTSQLNELFRPQSISIDTSSQKKHCLFEHEKEVLDLLQVIDGSAEDENILGFLDYDRLKEGKMCRHIVMVLPFCASCDAMEKLINDHKEEFNNLNEYALVNIAGHEGNFNTTGEIKHHIEQLERKNKKTITLTVNRMLTGSTVREWDTMIFLKDVSSPQEYDQAIFRLQNQYISTYKDDKGDTIKYNMKPQTLLVDFDPNRMFFMQEKKSMIYDINNHERGNDKLESRLQNELEISPIIFFNKGKITQVTPANIMDAVREYSANLTVMDEATDVPIDFKLLEDPSILDIIKDLDPINNKKGINIKPNEGEGDDYENPDDGDDGAHKKRKLNNKRTNNSEEEDNDQPEKRLATFFAQILFYSLLTDDTVKSLSDIIDSIHKSKENNRIMNNVGLRYDQLIYLKEHINPQILNTLDYKIQNTNDLLRDTKYNTIERVERALKKFGRLSVSEIVTPSEVADNMVAMLPKEQLNVHSHFLDIASKQGEFACALYKQFGSSIKNDIYAIPTSKLTYEFTYKVFKLLEIPTENIFAEFNSYDLIGDNKENYTQILKDMNFDVIIGNPPYQDIKATEKAGANSSFASALYPMFVDVASEINSKYITMIIPSRWMTKQGQGVSDEWVDKMLQSNHFIIIHDFPNATDCFTGVEIKGGINYFLMSNSYDGICKYVQHVKGIEIVEDDYLDPIGAGIIIRDPKAKSIINKVVSVEGDYYKDRSFTGWVSPKHYFDRDELLNSNWKGYSKRKRGQYFIKYYLNKNLESCGYGWVKESQIPKGKATIPLHKLYIPMAGGTGNDSQILGVPFYGEPNSVCSYTYLVIGYDPDKHNLTKEKCLNVLSYIRTRFFRFMVSIKKKTQNTTRDLFQFVPVQDFSKPWTDEMLYNKYDLSQPEIDYIEAMINPME